MLTLSVAVAAGLLIALLGWLAVALVHVGPGWGVLASMLAPLPIAIALLLRWWRGRGRGGVDPGIASVNDAWAGILAAAGEDVHPSRPWWLLLGASGCGKTGLLAESGVPWILRPTSGEVQRGPRLWRFDAGCILELPGTWADGRCTPPGWIRLLALLKARRGRQAVQGVVACVACGELLRRGPLATAVTAQAIRDRGEELAAALGSVPPLHLVMTKGDQIGGFKDFFAGTAREERVQELSSTLPWPPSGMPLAGWRAAHERLVAAMRDRRLAVLPRAQGDAAASKAFQFPIQLASVAVPIGELLGHLVQPGARESLPLWAVHLTSVVRSAAPATSASQPGGERTDLNASVFAGARRAGPSDAGGCALFARDLFQRALPGSAGLVAPTRRAGRAARRIRSACLVALPLCALLVGICSIVTSARQVSLLAEVRSAAVEARAVERDFAADLPRNLDACDRLGAALAALAAAGAPERALEAAGALHARMLGRLHLDRVIAALTTRIAGLRSRPDADTEALYGAFRAYQMLAGAVPVDPPALEAALLEDRRWFLGVERDGRLDWPSEVIARRQLERHARELLPRGLDRIHADRALVEGAARELGESLWIRLGLDDVLRTARGQFPAIDAPRLGATGPLGIANPIDGALSREAWNEAVSDLVDEKAATLARTLAGLGAPRPEAELRRRLAEGYATAHRRAWLAVLASARTVPADSPEAVPARLEDITGVRSPWPAFARRVITELDLRTGGLNLGLGPDTAWAQPALAAIQPLQGDVRGWLAAVPPGRRVAELDRTLALAKRFDEAWAAAGMAVAQVQPEDLREALRASLGGIVHGLWRPIDRALASELEDGWRSTVCSAWRGGLVGRFPFAESESEVALDEFARFANPVNGILTAGLAAPERLRAQTIAGRPALTVSPEFAAMAQRAQEIRAGFFSGEKVDAPFTIVLVQREGVADIVFACGAQTLRYYAQPDARYPAFFRQGEPGGARVSIKVVTNEWKARECAGQAWGLLRLLRSGDPHPASAGGWTLTWSFPGTAAGKDVVWRAQALLETGPVGRAAVGDLFTGFTIPDRIAPVETD